eukprot:810946-Rhodomonas_salina.1
MSGTDLCYAATRPRALCSGGSKACAITCTCRSNTPEIKQPPEIDRPEIEPFEQEYQPEIEQHPGNRTARNRTPGVAAPEIGARQT